MAMKQEGPIAWVKDETGRRYLCPLDALESATVVAEGEKYECIDDQGRLGMENRVPGDGKIRFAASASPN